MDVNAIDQSNIKDRFRESQLLCFALVCKECPRNTDKMIYVNIK